MSGTDLFGRETEVAVLTRLVDGVRASGGALVVRGSAGIGKSAVLDVAQRRALEQGMSVLTAKGAESELSLAFAGLHQLLLPVLSGAERLPSLQQQALWAAFGMATSDTTTDLFLVALAALTLLAEAAERSPLLLVVEDLQWLDRPSADALGFIARRVESEPIVVLFALRDGSASPVDVTSLPQLHLDALGDEPAGRLLEAHFPGLTPALRRRVMTSARGNPLALIELPSEVERTAGRLGGGEAVSLTSRLETAFADQSSRLPADVRTLLLLAAADEGVGHQMLLAAASAMAGSDIEMDALALIEEAGLARLDRGVVVFRHPLVRSAVYQSAGPTRQRAAHRALAEVLAGDPERRIWHLAAASVGQDEAVASGLEELATVSAARGAISVAAAAMERAARLSPEPRVGCARLLRAAELAFELGEVDVVQRLLIDAERLGPDRQQRARMTWLREIFSDGVPGEAARIGALVEGALDAERSGEVELALNLLLGAGLRCWWADPGEAARHRVVVAAEAVRVADTDPRVTATLAVAAPVAQAAAVRARLRALAPGAVEDPQAGFLLGMAAHAVYDCERAAQFFEGAAVRLRAQGRLGVLAQVLTMWAWDAMHVDDFAVGQAAADEGRALALETGQPVWAAGAAVCQALLLGLRGEVQLAGDLLAEAERTVIPSGLSAIMCVACLARGVVALAAGRPEDAVDHLQLMFDPREPSYHIMDRIPGIVYLSEAALLTGRRSEARRIVSELEQAAVLLRSRVLDVGLVYARAILAEDDEAGPAFEAALATELQRRPFHRARLQLAYGAWLRRRRRVTQSRAPLRAARDTFDALGTVAWAERARQELRASGERSRQRVPEARDQLSAQELQIARMAATGLSNREIAQQLYLSPRTVASHLYRLFPKLGITSRAQLAGALDADHRAEPSTV